MSNDNWKMPEPVFQRTSGSLPEDFAARAADTLDPTTAAATPNAGDDILSTLYAPPDKSVEAIVASPPQPVIQMAAIEPQPSISEQFSVAEIDTITPVVAAKKKGGARSIIFAVGIFVLLAVAAGFVALVYFLFLRQPPDSTF